MADPKMQSKYPDPKERKSRAIAICHSSIMGKMNKAVWSVAYQNNLPDSSFAYVEPGKKDKEGKTIPRNKRHLPYKDANGKIDPAHVRNALARLPQTNIPESAKASARAKLVAAARQVGIEVSEKIGKGGEIMIRKTVTTEVVSDEELEKLAEKAGATDKASFADCMKEHMKDGMSMQEATKECKMQMKRKADDSESVDDPKEVTEEAVSEEATAEETPAEGTTEEATVTSESTEAEGSEESTEEVAQADKSADLIKQVLDKIEAIEATLKKQDEESASAEGAASQEAAPEGATPEGEAVEDKAPAESDSASTTPNESGTEDASPEGAEVAKVLSKVSGQLGEMKKSLDERLGALEERITKVEEQPAPSKVVSAQVVTKGGNVNPNQERLDVINKELSELEEMKKTDLDSFQRGRKWEKALDLIAERDQLREA